MSFDMPTLYMRRLSPLAAVLVAALTSPATAVQLHYAVDAQASNSAVSMGTVLSADSSLDITDGIINGDAGQLPLNSTVVNGINTEPSSSSHAIADVGLPDDFDGGANGITFQELEIDYARRCRVRSTPSPSPPRSPGSASRRAGRSDFRSASWNRRCCSSSPRSRPRA